MKYSLFLCRLSRVLQQPESVRVRCFHILNTLSKAIFWSHSAVIAVKNIVSSNNLDNYISNNLPHRIVQPTDIASIMVTFEQVSLPEFHKIICTSHIVYDSPNTPVSGTLVVRDIQQLAIEYLTRIDPIYAPRRKTRILDWIFFWPILRKAKKQRIVRQDFTGKVLDIVGIELHGDEFILGMQTGQTHPCYANTTYGSSVFQRTVAWIYGFKNTVTTSTCMV